MVISLYVQPICATQPNLKIDTSVKVNRCRRDALHVDGRRLGLPLRRSGVALRRGIPGQAPLCVIEARIHPARIRGSRGGVGEGGGDAGATAAVALDADGKAVRARHDARKESDEEESSSRNVWSRTYSRRVWIFLPWRRGGRSVRSAAIDRGEWDEVQRFRE
ncbi:hypothetical protein [Streptomyces sp. NPDC091299]|uniref:hypothetical protein n=1 Tax=Streptomyces sp. NPDC091299 TaxID=3155302 RepID=UPI0034323EF0